MYKNTSQNKKIQIKGLVQGVGFRPFVYRKAQKYHLSGWVKNDSEGVIIEVTGTEKNVRNFISDLKEDKPSAANIYKIQEKVSNNMYKNDFKIIESENKNTDEELTQIGPDIAVCEECLQEMKIQPHRLNYPFINCINCGPRFSIIHNLPYDRDKTTMDVFQMCPVCRSEYENPTNRRFHAQPIACSECGPSYSFFSKKFNSENIETILLKASSFIDDGKIIAIKGIGGFFIACNATSGNSVKKLRKLKKREGKPFAVMFKDINAIKEYCILNETEIESLCSWQKPIVILKSKKILPDEVSNGLQTIGAILPYMPIHYLLFEKLNTNAFILTSGNFSDEPIIISNKKAESELIKICDAVLTNNREIYNRNDDSLLQIVNKKARIMRRSRGWAPAPVYIDLNLEGIFAAGAELKNTFCIGKNNQAILSQHIGDLKEFETYIFYEDNIEQFKKMFRFNPDFMVRDLHPEYFSSRYADFSGLPILKVQHHHAHIVSCMAEHKLDEKVIGVCFDGTGYGDDGNIWGSEFFICDLTEYKRLIHFEYLPLPGGDQAAKEPWRIAVSWLYKIFGEEFLNLDIPLLKNLDKNKIDWIIKAINNKINTPLTSGSGRLFDAVSALLGLCSYSNFEAEAPMRLENIANHNITDKYSLKISHIIQFSEMFKGIIDDFKKDISPDIISAKFHNTLIHGIIKSVLKIKDKTGLNKVILSGGTFQNRYLLERTENELENKGFNVYSNCSIPCNDGGISFGQLMIAAKKREIGLLKLE